MIRSSAVLMLICALFCLPQIGAAQEAPYAPTIVPTQELMLVDLFKTPPLIFPWTQISSGRVANRGRMDFEAIYDIDFQSAQAAIRQAHEDHESIIELSPEAGRHTEVTMLRIAGIESGSGRMNITLTHRDIEHVFQARLEPDGPRTRVIIANSALARTFSGFMPARAEFTPLGAKPIPFRWN